jgi:hypothetical protein
MTVLRRAYVPVEPDASGFDEKLQEQVRKQDPGGKAGKQIGGQLNRALKRLDLDPIDIKADPRQALAKIKETEERLRRLSGDSATVEIKVQTERTLGQLQRFKKQLGDLGDEAGPQAAEGFAARFSQRLGPLLTNVPLSPALIAAAAAAAPLIASTIAGAVVGGAGVGGVIGGVLLAAKDPRVQQAATSLSATLLGELQGKASGFIGPVLGAIDKVRRAFDDLDPVLNRIFNSSRFVQPLVDGAVQGVKGFLAGFANAVDKADPVINQLGLSLSQLGTAAGDFFTKMAGHADEGATAIRGLTHATTDFLDVAGDTIGVLSDVFGVLDKVNDGFKKVSGGASLLDSITFSGFYETIKTGGKNTDEAALSAEKYYAALERVKGSVMAVAAAHQDLVATDENVKTAQKAVTDAQKAYNDSLDALGPAGGHAAQVVDGLRKATQALYGSQIQATDANEAYQASWDALSESIKQNGRTLNIHSAAGRSNRDALEAVAAASKDMYFADIQAGGGIAEATKKHNKRIEALKEEAKRNGLDREETKKLVDTYGSIPKGKTTKLVVAGVDSIVSALRDLYVFQRSLADGIPINSEIAKLKGEKGPARRYGGYASGGAYEGRLPGPASSFDNLAGMGPDGDVFGLAGGEFIVNAKQTAKHRPMLEDLNSGKAGFASGGYYPVEQRPFRVTTNAGHTRIPSKSEVSSKVMLSVPSGGRTSDWIVRAARQIVPGIQVLSKDRPGARTLTGNVSYHALGRAVDFHWNRKLAEVWNQRYMSRTKELITPWQDLNIQNGRRHAYSPIVYNEHNFAGGNPHDHIAMANGGVIREPVIGVGASGRTYSFGERGAETVTPGVGGDIHIHLPHAVITSKRHAVDLVTEAYWIAKRERKIP